MKTTLKEIRTLIREEIGRSNLDKAIKLATEKHAGQTDKGGQTYIQHPMRVMQTVISQGYDESVAIAAILHDTVEDTDLTLADVEKEFGPRVAATVSLLSKLPGESYQSFIDRIIASKNVDAIKVKLADLTDNMDVSRLGREPDEWDKKRLSKYEKAFQQLVQALER